MENNPPADDTTSSTDPVLSDVVEFWPKIKHVLADLSKKSPKFNLAPEEVFDACAVEAAQLWTVPEGFIVTKFIDDRYTDEKTLFLWVAAAYDGGTNLGVKYLDFFDGVAKYMNCKYIELWSSRAGMERYIARHGFELFYRSFRKTV